MFGRRLNRLTAQQRRLIPLIRDEWIGVGLSTVPADRSEAQRGVEAAYRKAGLKPPAVIWLRSPFEEAVGTFMAHASAGVTLLGYVLEQQLEFELGDQALDRAWRVRDRVGEVRDQVESQLGCQVCDQVEWDQVWNQFATRSRARSTGAGSSRSTGTGSPTRSGRSGTRSGASWGQHWGRIGGYHFGTFCCFRGSCEAVEDAPVYHWRPCDSGLTVSTAERAGGALSPTCRLEEVPAIA